MHKNMTTDELVITNQILIFKVLFPSASWVVFALLLFIPPVDGILVREIQIYSGLLFYCLLFY